MSQCLGGFVWPNRVVFFFVFVRLCRMCCTAVTAARCCRAAATARCASGMPRRVSSCMASGKLAQGGGRRFRAMCLSLPSCSASPGTWWSLFPYFPHVRHTLLRARDFASALFCALLVPDGL